ncbi:MAG: hypothetical protein M1337_00695 [Actinobacteria bacterium]|nr:hypothetical protein [Actinomycetota bacterium]
MAAINIQVDDELKARLDAEAARQMRSQRAVVILALTRYFADLDRERSLAELERGGELKAS